jgi:hypothetical protein
MVVLVTVLAIAGPASSSSLLQVIELENGENVNTIGSLVLFTDVFEYSDLFLDGQPQYFESVLADADYQGCEFDTDIICSFSVDQYVDYVVIIAGKYAAVYAPWDLRAYVDTSTWGDLTNGGGKSFVPAISNFRAITPVPEPGGALLFLVGTSVVGFRIGRRGM